MKTRTFSLAQVTLVTFLMLILPVLVSSATGIIFSQTVDRSIVVTSDAIQVIDSASGLESSWFQVVASIDNMLLTRQTTLIVGRLAEQLRTFNDHLQELRVQPMGSTPSVIARSEQLVTSLTSLATELDSTVDELFTLAGNGSWARATALRHTELASLQRRFSDQLAELQANIHAGINASMQNSLDLRTATRRGWLVISLIVVLGGGIVAYIVRRAMLRQIIGLTETANAIQKGDLTRHAPSARVTEYNVLGDAFNNMTGQLAQSILSLQHNVEELEGANRERGRLIKELEEALLFKDQFLATMSHELRTPLNAVLGYSALILQEESIDPDTGYMVERIEGNSVRLLHLINDVLDISRINANRVEIVSRPIDLTGLVAAWYADFHAVARDKGLEFRLDIDHDLPPAIIGDEERLTQITGNLLQNAFKFTTKGFVGLKVQRSGSDKWQILVSDSGQGIPETWHHLIFDEFRQVDSGSKRKHGGAGLGLSIVKKLCLLMGGSVSVASKLDEGSTFTITLPLRTPETAAAKTSEITRAPQADPSGSPASNIAANLPMENAAYVAATAQPAT